MAEKRINSRIIHKHGTESDWNKATNFVPKQGELIIYDKDSTYSYERFKIGDGVTKVTALPFADAHKANASHTHTKSQITDFPTSLPANGGNADTVDGKHAADFATATGLNNLKSLVGDTSVSDQISSAISSKANTSDLTSHTGNTTVHITSSERTTWNAAKTHADSAHAPSNAEANQNAFSNVTVGSTTVAADSKTDTLTLAGSNVTLTPDATNDKITIGITKTNVTDALGYTPPTTNTTYGAAGSSLGLVKSGGDVSISSGVITVNDDSHNHVISNVDGLQDALDSKAAASDVTALQSLVGDTSVSSQISTAIASKSDTGHTHDDRYYTETEINNKLSGKSDTSHTHSSYVNQNAFSNVKVGSSTVAADSATDTLTLTAGNNITLTADTTNDGITIAAKDTVYTHPTTSGNKHIPSGGSSGQILRWSADGTAVWGADNDTTYSAATTSTAGLMSASDKTKLDGIATGANKTAVDSALSSTSTNPVQNKVVNAAITNLNTLVGDTAVSTQVNNALTSAKSYTDTKVAGMVDSAPETLDTLNELAAALGDDPNFATTVANQIGTKADANHTHKYAGSSSAGGAANSVANSMTVQLNGGTTEGTSKFTFNGSAAKSVNITPSAIGAAASSHGTHVSYSSTNPVMDGTASVGSASTVARSDHKHPTDTTRAAASEVTALKSLVGDTSVSTQISNALSSGNAKTATTLQAARTIDGVSFNGSANITHYGDCSTAAATAAKVVSLTGFTLATGARITVKFSYANTASSATLNVNSTGAKPIMYKGSAIPSGYIKAGGVYEFIYDGTNYELLGDINTDTNTTSFTITASASDDDVVVLTGTNGTNKVTYSASHAKKGPSSGYTSGNTTTSISGSGGSGTIKIPQLTVDTYGHVTAAADENVAITLPTLPTIDSALSSSSTNPVQNKVINSAISNLNTLVGDTAVSTQITNAIASKADKTHTHSYAGSSSVGGSATSAVKLDSSAGSATQPVYFKDGKPVATTYTLEKSVPSNAVFTDTDTKVTNTLGATTKAYITGTTSGSTNTGTQVFDTGVYLSTTAGRLETGSVTVGATSSAVGKCSFVYDTTNECVSFVFA